MFLHEHCKISCIDNGKVTIASVLGLSMEFPYVLQKFDAVKKLIFNKANFLIVS
jgi:hypothetical protein